MTVDEAIEMLRPWASEIEVGGGWSLARVLKARFLFRHKRDTFAFTFHGRKHESSPNNWNVSHRLNTVFGEHEMRLWQDRDEFVRMSVNTDGVSFVTLWVAGKPHICRDDALAGLMLNLMRVWDESEEMILTDRLQDLTGVSLTLREPERRAFSSFQRIQGDRAFPKKVREMATGLGFTLTKNGGNWIKLCKSGVCVNKHGWADAFMWLHQIERQTKVG